jgi:AcrR family transcriptional regulator
VADRSFYEYGIRAVGVDAIAAGAETAKTTLYSHFRSKDALVVAYLQQRAQHERERLERELAARAGSPADRILLLYDLLADELAAPGYRGSPFVNACVELARDHPAVAVARDHREWMLATITTLAAETGAPDPVALAAQLLQLYESVAVSSQLADATAVRTARAAAAVLVSTSGFAAAASVEPPPTSADRPRVPPIAHHSAPSTTRISLPSEALPRGGTPEAHRLVAFLNSAHLPDGDDQLADERAGTWLAEWLPPSGRDAPETSGKRGDTAAAAELLILREGLRQLAAINCGAPADPELVARAATVWMHTPLVVDLATAAQPQLIPAADPKPRPAELPERTAYYTSDANVETTRRAVAVLASDYLAVEARGEWPRLKVCASPECRWAFLDTTRNRSRRWCAMGGCGNRAKNRAWRERRSLVTTKSV